MSATEIILSSDCRSSALSEFYKVAEKFEVNLYLGYGVLLGAIRDGDFVGWDNSIELFVKSEDFDKINQNFIVSARKKGFCNHDTGSDFRRFREKLVFFYQDVRIAIVAWHLMGDYRVRRYLRVPSRFFGSDQVEFLGSRYLALHPPKDYLRFQYGKWEIPIKSGDSDDYFSRDCYRYPFFIYKVRKILAASLLKIIRLQERIAQEIKP